MDVKSPSLQQLYRDWERWRGARRFPSRANIDPLALRYILGDLSLVEVHREPLRFFYRIHATASTERMGFDLTGKFLDQCADDTRREIVNGGLTACLESRKPLSAYNERTMASRVAGHLEVLILPFSSDGENIDLIAIGTNFCPTDPLRRPAAAVATTCN